MFQLNFKLFLNLCCRINEQLPYVAAHRCHCYFVDRKLDEIYHILTLLSSS